VALDVALLSAAYAGAYVLRLGRAESLRYAVTILETLPVVLAISIAAQAGHGLYTGVLRYTSADTAVAVLKSVAWSVLVSCLVLFLLFRLDGVPRSVFVIHGMGAVLLIGGARFAFRLPRAGKPAEGATRIILYGAGDTAELVLRGLGSTLRGSHAAVGMIDDDPAKRGQRIHGVKILGGIEALRGAIDDGRAAEVWVAVHRLAGERLRKVYDAARERGARVKILPRLESALLERDLASFQEPDIVDLLSRPSRSLDRRRMEEWIRGRRVLITGAGGSVGSELARQVSRLGPASLALCDACELNLFRIHGELAASNGTHLSPPYLADVRDGAAVERMFEDARPDIVFHAAAYKHVPLVELNPCAGVSTNVAGLVNVALAARSHQAREFVFISTDKAVRPVSVMGATKRLGEVIIQVLGREGPTRFCAVRFGNVLGSSGSVVPIFQEQIRRGGPVTVTDPEMTRYFMLTSEAVELVIQAGSLGEGGEVFVLDMGEPVRIADMARELIRLMGKEPERDIRIEFTGPRPGEKIHEELLIDAGDSRTSCPDVWIDGAPPAAVDWRALAGRLDLLGAAAAAGDAARTVALLRGLLADIERPAPQRPEGGAAPRLREAARAPQAPAAWPSASRS
jgi:O-antigen biosynthesis protein WbqV